MSTPGGVLLPKMDSNPNTGDKIASNELKLYVQLSQ